MRFTETKETEMFDNLAKYYTLEDYLGGIQKLGEFEDIEEEYCITDNKDLRRRLDLADIYIKLSRQLGIDLITFFKIITAEKIYLKGVYGCFKILNYRFDVENPKYWHLYVGTVSNGYVLYLIDYGKTWALTKKELL